MKKITQFSKLNVRWISTKALMLLLLGLFLPIMQMQAQYCTPLYSSGCSSGDDLNSVVLNGNGASVLSDLNTGCTSVNGTGYNDKTALFTPVDLLPGQTYTIQLNTNYSPGWEYASVWIDFNNDNVFDNSTEKLLVDLSLVTSPAFSSGSLVIPLTATPGVRRMRVRVVYSSTGFDACSSYTWGETHDYNVNILALTPCSGTVNAGVATANVTSTCVGSSFVLSSTGVTYGGGVTYQWQRSPAGTNTFTNISGATNASHTITGQTAATDYRLIVTCTNSNSTQTSTIVSVAQKPITDCYCTPTYTYSCSNTSENINSFIINGEGTSVISDLNTGCSTGNYQNRTALFTPVNLLQDSSYPVQINTNYSSGQYVWASIWIDFNDNGVFESTEQLLKDIPMVTSPGFLNVSILIPDTAPAGIHRMRVRANYSGTVDACAIGSWGETHDYNVNVIAITCFRPTNVLVTDITKNSAIITVTPNVKNTGSVSFAYEVRESGKPGSGSTGLALSGTSTTNPFTIIGLQPLTKYTVYVKTVCSPTDSSGWSNGENLNTLCNYPDLITAPG
ncbi:GEVED domain-containing protein, partial [Paenimyroides viscosum]